MSRFLRLALFFFVASAMASGAHAERRIALVIGNAAYTAVSPLANPKNDADLMAKTLQSVGFEVTKITDADQRAMKQAMLDFGRKLRAWWRRDGTLDGPGVLALAIAAVVGLTALLNRTSIGHQMQATAQNPTVARIIGIPVERMILLTFLINAFLVALASMLITPIYLAKFSSGEVLGQAAFIAAIVGGFNQVRGAIAGGLLIGVVDNLAAAYVSTQYRAAVPMILLIAIILLRPQGLLGRAEERTV